LFERQGTHLFLLAALLALVGTLARAGAFAAGESAGLTTLVWFWIAIASAVAHQTFVMLSWRTELHHRLISRLLGRAGFPLYVAMFAVFGTSRFVSLVILAQSNAGTVTAPRESLRALALVFALPSLYVLHSVVRHFGLVRATGADHFDPRYRDMPLVREGIFRWVPNAMYTFGLLVVWMPGLWHGSAAALLAAAFHHAYIWVHYHCTEKPDMARIYG